MPAIPKMHRRLLNYLKSAGFWISVLAFACVFLVLIVPRETWIHWKDASETIRNFGLAIAGLLAATVGVYLAWLRTDAAISQAKVSEAKERREERDNKERLYTELFTKAIEQLSNEDLSVRLGGMYALQRIANESVRDHSAVMEVLSAYVRRNAPWEVDDEYFEAVEDDSAKMDGPSEDIQTALRIIGKRKISHDPEGFSLDLTRICVRCAQLSGLNFENFDFSGSNFRNCDLTEASLRACRFIGCEMSYAELHGADLRNASIGGGILDSMYLVRADLRNASIARSELNDVNFIDAKTDGLRFYNVDLNHARGITEEQLKGVKLEGNITMPDGSATTYRDPY